MCKQNNENQAQRLNPVELTKTQILQMNDMSYSELSVYVYSILSNMFGIEFKYKQSTCAEIEISTVYEDLFVSRLDVGKYGSVIDYANNCFVEGEKGKDLCQAISLVPTFIHSYLCLFNNEKITLQDIVNFYVPNDMLDLYIAGVITQAILPRIKVFYCNEESNVDPLDVISQLYFDYGVLVCPGTAFAIDYYINCNNDFDPSKGYISKMESLMNKFLYSEDGNQAGYDVYCAISNKLVVEHKNIKSIYSQLCDDTIALFKCIICKNSTYNSQLENEITLLINSGYDSIEKLKIATKRVFDMQDEMLAECKKYFTLNQEKLHFYGSYYDCLNDLICHIDPVLDYLNLFNDYKDKFADNEYSDYKNQIETAFAEWLENIHKEKVVDIQEEAVAKNYHEMDRKTLYNKLFDNFGFCKEMAVIVNCYSAYHYASQVYFALEDKQLPKIKAVKNLELFTAEPKPEVLTEWFKLNSKINVKDSCNFFSGLNLFDN